MCWREFKRSKKHKACNVLLPSGVTDMILTLKETMSLKEI